MDVKISDTVQDRRTLLETLPPLTVFRERLRKFYDGEEVWYIKVKNMEDTDSCACIVITGKFTGTMRMLSPDITVEPYCSTLYVDKTKPFPGDTKYVF